MNNSLIRHDDKFNIFDIFNNLKYYALLLLYFVVFVVFSRSNWHNFTGPFIFLTMLLLNFTDLYFANVAVLIMGNSALKTVFMGKIQFQYAVVLLIILRIVLNNSYKIKKKVLLFSGIIVLIFTHYLIVEGKTTFRPVLLTLLMFFALFYVLNDFIDDDHKMQQFFLYIGLTVFVSALSCVVFGGIKYHSTEYGIRYGVSGAGAGDPNFSGVYLVTGIAIILQSKFLKWYIKAPLIIVMVLAIARTMSITAFFLLCIVIAGYFLIEKNIDKSFLIILISLFVVGAVVYIYEAIPGFEIKIIEAYKERLLDKFYGYSDSGSVDSFTTGRTYLFEQYWQNFKQQYPLKILFGGNKLLLEGVEYAGDELVSHNTYIDLLRRYGIIPTLLFVTTILYKFFRALKPCLITKNDSHFFLLKLLYLSAAFTVTIHRSDAYVMWFTILLIL